LEDASHTYESLLASGNLEDLADEEALERIGILVDLSSVLGRREGLEHAVMLSEELQRREGLAPGLRATSDYFLANAWSGMRVVSSGERSLDLEQPYLEKEVLHLRRALASEEDVRELPPQRMCQILTNLGNAMSTVGRIVEAVEYWERALKMVARFPMALANRGHGLTYYSSILYDEGHQGVFLKHAHEDLSGALSPELRKHLEGNAAETFEAVKAEIEAYLRPEYLEAELDLSGFSLGDSQEEVAYREWCLENRLFLNPLNDLSAYSVAARDVFSQPSLLLHAPLEGGMFYQVQHFLTASGCSWHGDWPKRQQVRIPVGKHDPIQGRVCVTKTSVLATKYKLT
jgi:tetratricopeptide (TPR) repeat protein